MGGYIGSKASVVSSGAERKQHYNITTTTTSLTGLQYTPTKVHVYHNGIRLVDGTDYTATNGTSITLTNAAEDGDDVVVISYATFQTSDTVSAANGGTFAGNLNTVDIRPTTDDNNDLGTSSKRFQDLYLSGGIHIGGTGSANLLDDYEVGTWTAGIEINSSASGITYTSRSASYVKIGKLVFVDGDIQLSSKGSSTGTLRITGLPFTVYDRTGGTSLDGGGGLCAFAGGITGLYTQIGLIGRGGTTEVSLTAATSSGGAQSSNVTDTKITNSFSIRFSLTYRIA